MHIEFDRKPAKSFQDLEIWQRSHKVVLSIYELSASFPKSELYGLTSQIRRAAVSVPANIAESFRRRGLKDKANFLVYSQASFDEVLYYLILAKDLGYIQTFNDMDKEIGEISRMIEAYRKSILSEP